MFTSTVNIGRNGFSVAKGVVDPEKALANLTKIEQVLANNVPTASPHDSTMKELMRAAQENRDFFINYIESDTIFDKAWSRFRGKDTQVEDIYKRIQALIPKYEQNYREAIENAKAMGWKGIDEKCPTFMIDFGKNLKALVDAKVIEDKDIVRTPEGKVKIKETIENIKKGKKENLKTVMNECLANHSVNRFVQLGFLGLDFDELLRFAMRRKDWSAKECTEAVLEYVNDFSNFTSDFVSEDDLNLLTKLEQIPVANTEAALLLFGAVCQIKKPELVNSLLQKLRRGGVDYTDRKKFGQKPIFTAIEKENLIVFKYLVAQGADVISKDTGKSPVERLFKNVAIFGLPTKYDFLIELFKERPDLAKSTEEYHGSSALVYAILDEKNDVALELIKIGVNVNGKKNEPILRAIQQPNTQIVEAILTKGIELNLDNALGGGALIFDAVRAHNVSAIKLLVNAGAEIDAIDNKGDTALLYALKVTPINPSVVRELIQHGIDVHAIDKDGNTALLLAVTLNEPQLVESLLEAGSDPSHTNKQGKSPKALAANLPNVAPLFLKNLKNKIS